MAKLQESSESVIALSLIVMNLAYLYRYLFFKERFMRFQGDIFAEREPVLGCCGLIYLKRVCAGSPNY